MRDGEKKKNGLVLGSGLYSFFCFFVCVCVVCLLPSVLLVALGVQHFFCFCFRLLGVLVAVEVVSSSFGATVGRECITRGNFSFSQITPFRSSCSLVPGRVCKLYSFFSSFTLGNNGVRIFFFFIFFSFVCFLWFYLRAHVLVCSSMIEC